MGNRLLLSELTSAGLTPTSQSPENSVEMEAPPTVPNFTAQYSQPGHFGLLMVSEGIMTIKLIYMKSRCTCMHSFHMLHAK